MKCEHHAMPKQPRPRTVVTFSDEETAEALRDYALRMGQQLPTGKMCVWGRERDRKIQLCIERGEGQDVWPPEDVGDD